MSFTSFEPPERVNNEVGLEYLWWCALLMATRQLKTE